jgi:hypothetical protein
MTLLEATVVVCRRLTAIATMVDADVRQVVNDHPSGTET